MQLFERRVIMAPMAGVNTLAFCELLRGHGCDFIYTGLLTSHGMVCNNKKTKKILSEFPDGVTLAAQIFGGSPDIMADAARILAADDKVDLIDVNMGCPVPKVVKSCAGVRLMQNPELAAEIVRAVVNAVDIPVTVKMRIGWHKDNLTYMDLAKRCRDAGASAVALHPRTRSQRFTGTADWTHIARLKEAIEIPVIASGDIVDCQTAERCYKETGCDSIMIGRAAMGNPRLIGRVKKYLETGKEPPLPDFRERLADARRQLRRHVQETGPVKGVYEMRGPMAKYVHGLPGATSFRAEVNKLSSMSDVLEKMDEYEFLLEKRERNGKI